MQPSDRLAEVWWALEPVTDPELDRSVVELGFIGSVAVEGRRVEISFRLPTFWCSASFAFIMAEDMREAVHRLGWIEEARIILVDHFAAERINAGIAASRPFREVFGPEAAGDLEPIRETFRRKAYLGRMSALIEGVRAQGRTAEEIVATRMRDLHALRKKPALQELVDRFRQLRMRYGGSTASEEPAFRTPDGCVIEAARLSEYLREIRMTRRSAEANGEMCRMLLKARYEEAAPPAAIGSPA